MTDGMVKKVDVYFKMYVGAGTKIGDFINELEQELDGVSKRMATSMIGMGIDVEEEER